MISREGTDVPSDAGHVHGLEAAGATVLRGTGRIAGQGVVTVTSDEGVRTIRALLSVAASRRLSPSPGGHRGLRFHPPYGPCGPRAVGWITFAGVGWLRHCVREAVAAGHGPDEIGRMLTPLQTFLYARRA